MVLFYSCCGQPNRVLAVVPCLSMFWTLDAITYTWKSDGIPCLSHSPCAMFIDHWCTPGCILSRYSGTAGAIVWSSLSGRAPLNSTLPGAHRYNYY